MKRIKIQLLAGLIFCMPLFAQAQNIEAENYQSAVKLLQEANTAKNQKDQKGAIDKYVQAFELSPAAFSYSDYFNLSYLQSLEGNYDDAIKYAERAAIKRPEDYRAYYNIGRYCDKKGDYNRAIMYYKKAVEVDTSSVISYMNMGNDYESLENYSEAVKCYEKALEITPDDSKLYVNMGLAYYKMGDTDKQEECYRQAADLGHVKAQEWLNGTHYKWGLTVMNITQGKLVADK